MYIEGFFFYRSDKWPDFSGNCVCEYTVLQEAFQQNRA